MQQDSTLQKIPFNKPAIVGRELYYINEAMNNEGISGSGPFVEKCENWFLEKLKCNKVLLTGSCTHALEIAALLLNLKEGDEVIMPSYTFVTTANAFVLHGATPVFIDIHPDTMNMDEKLLEAAISSKTRAIVPVHYAGVACNMQRIQEIAEKHHLIVIEDAAQSIMSQYNNKPLGTFGDMAAYSFHETKNYTSGEGGALIINDPQFIERAEIIAQKGTNRTQFLRGETDKYSWVDIGSSYVMSELNAAYLYGQLEASHTINSRRHEIWNRYNTQLQSLCKTNNIQLPIIPKNCQHNAHLFFIKCQNLQQRTALIQFLKKQNIHAVFHYVPLHSSKAGKKYSRLAGTDTYTTTESERILRLPLYYNITNEEVDRVICALHAFFN